ncbi:MAG: glycosyltransferase family 2 protein [bacterium]|nr:glycosyltransferase family 2 protein [bacterium]
MFKLSICIPTYNRRALLEEALESILCQLHVGIADTVEIVVSDNASTDGTDSIVEAARSRHPHVTYHRWDNNVGPDRNYMKTVELARGRYCWLYGCDDLASPDSIARLVEYARRERYDIVLSDRYEFWGKNSSNALYRTWSRLTGDLEIDLTNDPKGFLRYVSSLTSVGGLFSFLTSIVFRRSAWEAVTDKERFIGTGYPHTHVLLVNLKNGGRMHYTRKPFVLCRMGDDSFCKDPKDLESIYRRIKLDILGYREIPIYIFGADSPEYHAILDLLGRIYRPKDLVWLKIKMRKDCGIEAGNRIDRLARATGLFRQYIALSVASGPVAKALARWMESRERTRNARKH